MKFENILPQISWIASDLRSSKQRACQIKMNVTIELTINQFLFPLRVDKRVDGWLFMDSCLPTVFLTLLYLLFVKVAPGFMRSMMILSSVFLFLMLCFLSLSLFKTIG